jgi:hypothetical protein
MSSRLVGYVVPIPTLLPDTEIGELPTAELPVKTGTVFVVPLPVTVCAAAPTAKATRQNPNRIDFLSMIRSSFPSLVSYR